MGYPWRAVAENIAKGQNSEKKVVEAWITSEGHCENMMNGTYKDLGAAESNAYWTMVLAKK